MKRILIVEDEQLLALMLEDMLLDDGYEVEHAFDLAAAEKVIASKRISAAILDINVGGQSVFPLARRLMKAEVPVLFASAQHRIQLPPEFRWLPLIRKPYTSIQISAALKALLDDVTPMKKYTAMIWRSIWGRGIRTSGDHPSL